MKHLVLFTCLLAITNNSCNRGIQVDADDFLHAVYFWAVPDLSEAAEHQLLQGMETLRSIKGIKHIWIGPPAHTPREVVDNSYTYAFVVLFESKAAHDAYQVDPIHTSFINQHKDKWTRVQIYDNVMVGDKR